MLALCGRQVVGPVVAVLVAGQIVAVRWVVAVGTVGPWVCRTATYWFWPHQKQNRNRKYRSKRLDGARATYPPAHVGGSQISIACRVKESVYIQCASATCPQRCCCYNFRGRSVRYEPAGTMLRVVSRTYCASVDCACVCAFCMTVFDASPLAGPCRAAGKPVCAWQHAPTLCCEPTTA